MASNYSIKDLERISGIKAHTLRIWEQRYNILKPARTSTNIRYYADSDLKRILNIALLNNHGLKISSIARLSEEEILAAVDKFLHASRKETDQIDTLVLCLMDMDEERFENTVNNAVIHFGFETTIEKIIFPFLRHLGNMWQVSLVTPAQEHYISNLIRQKLIVGLDNLRPVRNRNAKVFLFFLPGQELHELGLIYAHYLARAKGHRCVYLGQCVPMEDLTSICKSVNPDYLVTIFTSQISAAEIKEVLGFLDQEVQVPNVLLSGRLLFSQESQVSLPSQRFTLFKDFSEFRTMLLN